MGGIKIDWWRCLGCGRRLRHPSLFPLSSELQSGSWTSRRGAAGCGSRPRARSRSLSWRTRPRVRRREGDGSVPLRGEEGGAEALRPGVNPLPLLFFQESFLPKRRWSSSLASLWRASRTPADISSSGLKTGTVRRDTRGTCWGNRLRKPSVPSLLLFVKDSCFQGRNIPCVGWQRDELSRSHTPAVLCPSPRIKTV